MNFLILDSRALLTDSRALLTVVDDAIRKASQLGFGAEEFSTTLYARTQTAPELGRIRKLPALFVECNRPQLKHFTAQLRAALPLRVSPMLLEDLAQRVQRTPASLQRYVLVVTTFVHAHEIQTLLARTAIEVVGLLAEANIETLLRMTALPEGTKVGVWAGPGQSASHAPPGVDRGLLQPCGSQDSQHGSARHGGARG